MNTTTPYSDGTAVKIKATGLMGKIHQQCKCTSMRWIHYEVMLEGSGHPIVINHDELEQL